VLLTETRSLNYDGLDLTCASLVAIAKYPWLRAETVKYKHEEKLESHTEYRRTWRKFSVYQAEEEAFKQARRFLNGPEATAIFRDNIQSLEASIMDAADDITYAIHDLEDFYLAGMLDVLAVVDELENTDGSDGLLVKLRERLKIDYPDYYDKNQFEHARKYVRDQLPAWFSPKYEGDLDKVGRARAAASELIGRYINSVSVKPTVFWSDGPFIALGTNEWHEVQILKEVMRNFVITRSDIAMLQRGQQKVLKKLVYYLFEWKESSNDFKRLPRRLRQEIEIARDPDRFSGYAQRPDGPRPYAPRGDENRCILDYICGLTDGQCYSLYYKLSGGKPSAAAMDFVS
jgi:dGTPase